MVINTLFQNISFSKKRISKRTFSIFKNSLFGAANKVVSLLMVVFLYPVIINNYGVEKFGFLTLLLSFSFAFLFSDLGLGTGLQNLYPKIFKIEKQKRYISSTFVSLILISISFLLFGLLILNLLLSNYFNNKYNLFTILPIELVDFFYFSICIAIPFSLVQKIEIGKQEAFINSIFILISNLLIIVFCLILGYYQIDFIYICYVFFSFQTLSVISNYIYYFYFRNPNLKPNVSNFKFSTSIIILKQGIVYFLILIVNLFGSASDSFLVSHFINLQELATYMILIKIVQLMSTPIQIFIEPLGPALNESLIKKDVAWTKKALKSSFILASIYTAFCMFFFSIFIVKIIKIWLNQDLIITNYTLISYCFLFIPANLGGIFSSFFNTNVFFRYFIIIISVTNFFTFIAKIFFIEKYGIASLNFVHTIVFIICYSISFLILKNKYLSIGTVKS